MQKFTGIFLMFLLLTGVGVLPAAASGDVVGDGSPGSCTEAALDEALAGGGNITFNCGGSPVTITVSSQKTIRHRTTIDGGNLVTISGGGRTRIFYNINTHRLFTLRNITIANGATDGNGAGVYSDWKANLTVENVKFYNNVSRHPTRAVPQNNDYGGGAIFHHSGTFIVRNSEFRGNRVINGSGGAIHNLLSNMSVTDSVFEDNHAEWGYAGAIYVDGTKRPGRNGVIRLERTRFANNSGQGQGGAVFTFIYPREPGSRVIVSQCEFTNNRVTADARGDAFGGALRHGNGPLTITNTTFTGNTAGRQGGALWTGERGNVSVSRSTFNNNTAQDASQGYGGAIMIVGRGSFRIGSSTFNNNRAGSQGGAVFGGRSVSITQTALLHNSAGNPWGINITCGATYGGGGNRQTMGGSADRRCTRSVTIVQ